MIPGDFVSNFMIAVAAQNISIKNVYNLSTSSRNPLKLGRLV